MKEHGRPLCTPYGQFYAAQIDLYTTPSSCALNLPSYVFMRCQFVQFFALTCLFGQVVFEGSLMEVQGKHSAKDVGLDYCRSNQCRE
ncbi:hypothetical protein VNO80_25366 [Phaseolus coccineus]|uniref:Uncharacterized protein n=1 Tax=Phaseolus coccineus TaxID=3886 RepID=A0AAN9LU57_PHACN